MKNPAAERELFGCTVFPLSFEECREILDWTEGKTSVPAGLNSHSGFRWGLFHLTDGVAWGRQTPQGSWEHAGSRFPGLAPLPASDRLLECRLFGPAAEVLLWKDREGFRGRILAEAPASGEDQRPIEEKWFLHGEKPEGEPREGFCAVTSGNGRRQVLPLPEPGRFTIPRLLVRHYLEQDPEDGCFRIAVSRLVDLVFEEASFS